MFIARLLFVRSAAFDASKCDEMLAQGKRNLLCGEVPQSVNQLQEVCRLLCVCINTFYWQHSQFAMLVFW